MSEFSSVLPPVPVIPTPTTISFSPPVTSEPAVRVVKVKPISPIARLGSPLILPQGYGCVVMTGITSILLILWKSTKVSDARKHLRIPVPLTHAANSLPFNCTYRALQSTLEIYPQFLFLLVIGGLEMPYFTSLGGIIWIWGRYVYARGYYSGDPRNRAKGSFHIVGLFMMAVATLRFGLKRILS